MSKVPIILIGHSTNHCSGARVNFWETETHSKGCGWAILGSSWEETGLGPQFPNSTNLLSGLRQVTISQDWLSHLTIISSNATYSSQFQFY